MKNKLTKKRETIEILNCKAFSLCCWHGLQNVWELWASKLTYDIYRNWTPVEELDIRRKLFNGLAQYVFHQGYFLKKRRKFQANVSSFFNGTCPMLRKCNPDLKMYTVLCTVLWCILQNAPTKFFPFEMITLSLSFEKKNYREEKLKLIFLQRRARNVHQIATSKYVFGIQLFLGCTV